MKYRHQKNRFLILVFLGLILGACSSKYQGKEFEKEQIQNGRHELNKVLNEIDPSGALEDQLNIEFQIEGLEGHSGESFDIKLDQQNVKIGASSGAGVNYAFRELAQQIKKDQAIPEHLEISESPSMRWRGISLQLMKLGRYNYAVTPEEFPFFYNKELWIEFLDFMADQRYNYIILWNGHPFDYFVKFDKFKEAQAGMSDEQIAQNNAMLKWLIAEGGKRNIKFFFEFYNINTSVYYQEAHQLPDELSLPTDELAAYTEYSISRFVNEFPEVGLFVTPGEGLERSHSDTWINDVIFKAIKSTPYRPTVFMRAWFFDLEHARKITAHYDDLYFVRKFNVEMIADKRVDPENKEWAALNGNFVVNIHLAANLEPFRWNPPSYIKTIVQNNIESGAQNIHLHPRKAWRWPYGSDLNNKKYQWQRDTLFFTAWSRYAWNADRDEEQDKAYWLDLLSKRYGNEKAAIHYLQSAEAGADVLPALQRLIWLGYDNHTIVTAGATVEQLIHAKGIPFLDLSPTMKISDFIEALKSGKPITGETPIDFLSKKLKEAENALNEAKIAYDAATVHKEELKSIVLDAEAIVEAVKFYFHKMKAVEAWILMEEGIDSDNNRQAFVKYLSMSVDDFSAMSKVCEKNYESVSDVWASHPIRLKKNPYHWSDVLPLFEKELNIYKQEFAAPHPAAYYEPQQNGLAGVLYSEPGFVDPEKLVPAMGVDYNWDNDPEIGRHWSYKWSGFIQAPETTSIKFITQSDRLVKLRIGDREVPWTVSENGKCEKTVQVEKGHYYRIEIMYDHPGGIGGHINLNWQYGNNSPELIPAKNLFHSEADRNQTKLLSLLNKEVKGM